MQLKTVVCIGTGPSLTPEQVETARQKGFELYGCNLIYEMVPDLTLFYSVNYAFYEHYWDKGLSEHTAEKWTTNAKVASHFDGMHWIAEPPGTPSEHRPGLSTDPKMIHHGHGSGGSLVSMAHRNGADRIILLGYDMQYAPDYDGRAQQIGSSDRHYFGEYPQSMQHWPSEKVDRGKHVELIEWYRSIHTQGLVEVVNCTPDSAIDCFEAISIEDIE